MVWLIELGPPGTSLLIVGLRSDSSPTCLSSSSDQETGLAVFFLGLAETQERKQKCHKMLHSKLGTGTLASLPHSVSLGKSHA